MINRGMLGGRSKYGNFDLLALSINVETLSGNKILTITDKVIQWLDPGGASRNVTFPAEADSSNLLFCIYNNADGSVENLVCKNDGGTEIATIGSGSSGVFSCDGTNWKHLDDLGVRYDAQQDRIYVNAIAINNLQLGVQADGRISSGSNAVNLGLGGIVGTVLNIITTSAVADTLVLKEGKAGIRTATPGYKLDINTAGAGAGIAFLDTRVAFDAKTLLPYGRIFGENGTIGIDSFENGDIRLLIAGSEKERVTKDGNVGFNTTNQFGSGIGVIGIKNAGTNPSTNPVDCCILFCKDYDDGDATATSELFVRDEDGNETNLSPHAFELYQPDPDDPLPWTYNSTNYTIGKQVNADMSGALRALEALTGKKFLYYRDIEPEKRISLEKYKKTKEDVLIKDYQEKNITEVEISMDEAIEIVEVEIEDNTKVIGKEKRYSFDPEKGRIEEEISLYGKKKVKQKRLKENVRLDEETGKFFKALGPSKEEAKKAVSTMPKIKIKQWISDKLGIVE